jgi:hypothetical protein
MTTKTFPQVRHTTLGKADLAEEHEWLSQHGHEYAGQWVVLGRGQLVGHTADSKEVAGIVADARRQGISFPYVKFINGQSEPVWMGWL